MNEVIPFNWHELELWSRRMLKFYLRRYLIDAAFLILLSTFSFAQTQEKRLLVLDDMDVFRDVSDPQISPDGKWVVYTVSSSDLKDDQKSSDLWMTTWEGTQTVRLTFSRASEHTPRWSPDGKYLSFLSSRNDDHEMQQLWLMNRAGGEAEKITECPGGVSDYVWAPDGHRLALIVADADSEAIPSRDQSEKKTAPPLVINRFQFKKDEVGYLRHLRQHLFILNLATRKIELLTPSNDDEYLPAWSPDSKLLVFVSKRGPDPDRHDNYDLYVIEAQAGAMPRQLTTFAGADCHPDWESRPAWSPDGKSIAYLQGGAERLIYYAVYQVAVISVAGGPAKLVAPIDRNMYQPKWSTDGTSIYFLLEDDRATSLAKVPTVGGEVVRLVNERREITDYDLAGDGKLVLLSSRPHEPYEVFAFANNLLRPLARQNEDLFSKLKLGAVDEINFKNKDGTLINGFVVKPPGYVLGQKYPAILRIHGGPVAQYSNEFMMDWQLFAAHGYVVVACNPRGSSGRGEAFSSAIYADWGNKDAQDVLAAVDYVVAQGLVDPERLGVGGWSYGGMLTNYVIAQDTRFKAAVSGASISNIGAGYGTDQYIREYELELGTPWQNPDIWARVSFPFLHADRIITPTLFLCGQEDFNVPLLNSEQMYQALRSLGRDTQLIIYPGEYHEIAKPSYQRDRLKRYLEWYDKYLMPKAATRQTAKGKP